MSQMQNVAAAWPADVSYSASIIGIESRTLPWAAVGAVLMKFGIPPYMIA